MNAAVLHTLIAGLAIVAYAVLTALGHDGNDVLVAGLAYGGGAAVQAKASSAGGA